MKQEDVYQYPLVQGRVTAVITHFAAIDNNPDLIRKLDDIANLAGRLWRSRLASRPNSKTLKFKAYLTQTIKAGEKHHELLMQHVVAEFFGLVKPPNAKMLDHIDRNPLNNTLVNLRWTDARGNSINRDQCTIGRANRKKSPQPTSKFRGVSWYKRRGLWQVVIPLKSRGTAPRVLRKNADGSMSLRSNGYKHVNAGRFTSEIEAALVYNRLALADYGEEFAQLNIIPGFTDAKGVPLPGAEEWFRTAEAV